MGAHDTQLSPSVSRGPEQVLADVKRDLPSALGHFKAAFAGRSRKAAITSFCLDCMGLDRVAVRECSVTGCPLYPYRPKQRHSGDPADRTENAHESSGE